MQPTERVTLTVPDSLQAAANRLAAIFDPDTGGHRTFSLCPVSPTGELPATHWRASGLIMSHYAPILTNYDTALPALQALATQRDREQPDPADVAAWCDGVIVGETPDLLPVSEVIDDE